MNLLKGKISMNTREAIAIFLLALVALCFGRMGLLAQEPASLQAGTSGNSVYQVSDLDSVNLSNGNLTLRLPLGQSYPVGGDLSYGIRLSYNSTAWTYEDSQCLTEENGMGQLLRFQIPRPAQLDNVALGWSMSLGRLLTQKQHFPDLPNADDFEAFSYLSTDGGRHRFFEELHPGTPVTSGVSYSNDGTYLRLRRRPGTCGNPPPGSHSTCYVLDFPDGREHSFFNVSSGQDPNWRVTEIRDPFGNFLWVSYDTHSWTLTDSQGRVQTITFDPSGVAGSYRKPTALSLAAFDENPLDGIDSRADYAFEYRRESIERHRFAFILEGLPCIENPSNPIPPEVLERNLEVDLLSRIVLPDGSFYDFDYDLEESFASSHIAGTKSGALRDMRIPTGARYRWDYEPDYEFFYVVPQGFEPEHIAGNVTLGVVRREIFDIDGTSSLGDWLYEPGSGPFGDTPEDLPCYRRTKVTDPAGHWEVHYFQALDGPQQHLDNAPFTLCAPGTVAPSPHGPLPLAGELRGRRHGRRHPAPLNVGRLRDRRAHGQWWQRRRDTFALPAHGVPRR